MAGVHTHANERAEAGADLMGSDKAKGWKPTEESARRNGAEQCAPGDYAKRVPKGAAARGGVIGHRRDIVAWVAFVKT